MARVVIIGAGLTGISTAYHLEKNGFFDYKIFEKEAQIGGLCKSVQQDGFTFDYTGHLLHINDNYFQDLIKNIVNLDNFNLIARKSFVYSHEKYTPYPYQTNLYGLPTNVIEDCICGFVDRKKYNLSRNNKSKNTYSYYQWVLQNFGSGFGKHFFFPYQQKIFSYDARKLSSTWTGRFVPKTSLRNLIKGSVEENQDTVGYNSKFFYPKKGGIYYLIKKFAQQLLNPIQTNFCIKTIDSVNKILIFDNGHTEKYDILINTGPLDNLLNSIKDTHKLQALKNTSSKLLCNSVVNFNLGVFSEKTYDKHWIYYPENIYPFYRTGFFHNYSENMAPKGCSNIYGEFSYLKKSKNFINNKLELCLKESKKLLEINDKEILTEKILHIKHAYVIYDMWREKNITKIHNTLKLENIHSIGRYGQWKYSSMQEAVLDGKQVVEKLITNNFAQEIRYWKISHDKIIKDQNLIK
jgi:protoporphyrinogen oxidase